MTKDGRSPRRITKIEIEPTLLCLTRMRSWLISYEQYQHLPKTSRLGLLHLQDQGKNSCAVFEQKRGCGDHSFDRRIVFGNPCSSPCGYRLMYCVVWHVALPEGVRVAPGTEAAGRLVQLPAAVVVFHDVVRRAFLDVHALVAVGDNRISADNVVPALIFSVRPLRKRRE